MCRVPAGLRLASFDQYGDLRQNRNVWPKRNRTDHYQENHSILYSSSDLDWERPLDQPLPPKCIQTIPAHSNRCARADRIRATPRCSHGPPLSRVPRTHSTASNFSTPVRPWHLWSENRTLRWAGSVLPGNARAFRRLDVAPQAGGTRRGSRRSPLTASQR